MEQHLLFPEKLRYERERRAWSQEVLAEKVGCDTKTVGRWECGERLPRPHYRQLLCELFGKDAEELGLVELTPEPASFESCPAEMVAEQVDERVPAPVRLEDWQEAPAPIHLYGREEEAGELERWLTDQRCRVIAVSGMGGVGKSILVSTAANHMKENFEGIFWRSLHSAPPLERVVKQFLSQLSQYLTADLPEALDDLPPLLMQYLRDRRCLLVLDNLESIMQPGLLAGSYREGYAAYGKLIRLFAETSHRSCLVLISREKPKEVAWLEGITAPVRTLSLAGIDPAGGQKLLKERGLSGSRRDCAELIERYSGNPLALQQISGPVRGMFGGSIARFLQEGAGAFAGVSDLLEQHVQRLSDNEREILYRLAIEREVVPLELLRERLAQSMSAATLLETLDSLCRRSLIEIRCPTHFTLPAILMEYVTGCLLEQAYQEFIAEKPGSSAFNSGGPQRAVRGKGGTMRKLVTVEN